jgi:hypothetical protein
MATLREQLAKKRAQQRSVMFPIGTEGAKAQAELEEARQALRLAQMTDNPEAIKNIQKWRRRVETVLGRHSMTIIVKGLSEEARDALASEYPATPEQRAEDEAQIKAKTMSAEDRRTINLAMWLPAALAKTVVVENGDVPFTEEEWTAELADEEKWTAGEKRSLFAAIVSATNEGPAPGIPLG